MVRGQVDMMSRQLAVTLLVGSLIGSGFWAGLIVLLVR